MFLLRLFILCTFVFLNNLWGQNAFAGSGAFKNETVDASTLGMGNASTGDASTPAAVYFNPAGLNQIDTTSIEVSDSVLAPRASFEPLSGNVTQMQNNEYDIPAFYSVLPIIKNKLTIGAGSGSYWGLGTDWAQDSFSRYTATKDDLYNTDSMLNAAYQVTDQWSLAAGVVNDYSKADENKKFANPYDAVGDGNLELKANDDAWGFKLGTMFKINDQNQVGLTYNSPITHHYVGHVYLDNIGTNLSNGIGLGGANSYETRATEKLTLPQSVVLGYSFKPTTKWKINADVEWTDWSSLKHEMLSFPDAASGPSSFLNTGNPLVHDWHSTWNEEIGTEYAVTEKFRLRAGYFHHQVVGPTDYFDSAIPDLDAHGVAGGFGFDITPQFTIDVAYAGIFYVPRKVNSTNNSANGLGGTSTNIDGTYSQFVNVGVVSLTYKF